MKRINEIAVIAACAAGLYWAWLWFNEAEVAPVGVAVEARSASEVRKEETVAVAIVKPVRAYRPAVKRSLNLPEAVAGDKNQHVIASSQTAADERPHTVSTVINQQTGEVQTFDRADPLPWLAVNTKSELGVFVGMKSGEQAIRIEGRQELLQVKALHFGAIASTDIMRGGTDAFIGAGLWARW